MAIVLDAKTVPFSYWLCEKLNHCKSDIENPNQRKCVRVCIFVADSFSCFSSGDFFLLLPGRCYLSLSFLCIVVATTVIVRVNVSLRVWSEYIPHIHIHIHTLLLNLSDDKVIQLKQLIPTRTKQIENF